VFLLAANAEKTKGLGRVIDVVDAYEQGLLGRFPRARYLVGMDCFTFFLPLQMLPEWLGDWLIQRLLDYPKPIGREE